MERCRDQLLVIRYEDFVTDPAPALDRLGAWLGVDPGGFDCSRVHGNSLGTHPLRLSPREIADVAETAGSTMERYGYATP
jgi:hypothetical protein